MNIHELLKKYRESNGYTQEALAQQLLISRQAISKWEQGLSYPEVDNIMALSELYDISVDELLRGFPYFKKPFYINKVDHRIALGVASIIYIIALVCVLPTKENWIYGSLFTVMFIGVLMFIFSPYAIVSKKGITFIKYFTFKSSKNFVLFEEIESFTLIYMEDKSRIPGYWSFDLFSYEFSLKNGKKYKYDAQDDVVNHLPSICHYLSKKGVEIIDPHHIIEMVKNNIYIYDGVRKEK